MSRNSVLFSSFFRAVFFLLTSRKRAFSQLKINLSKRTAFSGHVNRLFGTCKPAICVQIKYCIVRYVLLLTGHDRLARLNFLCFDFSAFCRQNTKTKKIFVIKPSLSRQKVKSFTTRPFGRNVYVEVNDIIY